jgi:hypothetical protein
LIRTKYAWPGGYEIVFIANDGELLCNQCVKDNFRSVVWSMRNRVNDGWRIVEYSYEAVSAEDTRELAGGDYVSYCAHCNKEFGELGR